MDSPKNYHNIETFIEATNNEIIEEIAHKTTKICKPFKRRIKNSFPLQGRDDIVIANPDKGG